jgi:2-keto-4-pentenoate hydratase/2-oxohepta-3-ene-1,7-dioic acid hydratase in catechol pathway
LRLCRFDDDHLGLVAGDRVHDVTAALARLPAVRWPLPRLDPLVAQLSRLREDIEAEAARVPPLPLAGRTLRSPVASPGKIVAVRQNYSPAAGGTPDLFLKASSSVVGPGEGVVLGRPDRTCRHEIELAVVIGATTGPVPPERAMECVAGYCIGLDMTLSGDEDRGLRKSADSFTVLGPWLTTADEVPRPEDLGIELRVSGELRQRGSTAGMTRGVAALIAAASRLVTLHPGDVLLTGSPPGAGPVCPGDILGCRIERLGSMDVAVRNLR